MGESGVEGGGLTCGEGEIYRVITEAEHGGRAGEGFDGGINQFAIGPGDFYFKSSTGAQAADISARPDFLG